MWPECRVCSWDHRSTYICESCIAKEAQERRKVQSIRVHTLEGLANYVLEEKHVPRGKVALAKWIRALAAEFEAGTKEMK